MDVGYGRFSARVLLLTGALSGLSACTSDKVVEAPTGFRNSSSQCSITAVPDRFLVTWKDGSISVEHARDRKTFFQEVMEPNKDGIQFAEHDHVIRLAPPGQAALAQDAGNDWGQKIIEAPAAWERGVQGQGVIVAVIDSGVDVTHPQIRTRLALNPNETINGLDDDGNGLVDDIDGYDFDEDTPYVSDGTGHGTHVAGVIVADHDAPAEPGAQRIQGVAPGARLLPLDFMNDQGAGSISDAIRAIHYAVSRGARVINASWGGGECSETLRQTISELGAHGVLMVVAAGNSGSNLDWGPEFPAAFNDSSQLTVAATSSRDILAGFSNYSYSLVHLAAPGVNILSTLPRGRAGLLSGTSMATPFVSAAAALLFSYRPGATAAQVRQALLKSVDKDPSDPHGVLAVQTGGRLNVRKALDELALTVP